MQDIYEIIEIWYAPNVILVNWYKLEHTTNVLTKN